MKLAVLALVIFALPVSPAAAKQKKSPAGHPAAGVVSACDRGEPAACAEVAAGLLALGKPGDLARAAELFKPACYGGDRKACAGLAEALERAPQGELDPQRAATLRAGGCVDGTPRECEQLGRDFAAGKGVQRDEGAAAEAFGKACEGGLQTSCLELAHLLVRSRQVPPDPARAQALLEKGCEKGLNEACDEAADALERGPFAGRDLARSQAFRQRACEAGLAADCTLLGRALAKDPKGDPAKAAALYEKGCDAGDGRACWELSQLTFQGKGVKRDDDHAVELALVACAQGLSGAVCQDASMEKFQALAPPQALADLPPKVEKPKNWMPTLVAAGAAALLGGAGAYEAVHTQSLRDDFLSDPSTDTPAARSSMHRSYQASRFLYAGAAVAALTSAVLLIAF